MGIALCVPLCHDGGMTYDTTRLAALGAERAPLVARVKELTPALHEEMLAAKAAGVGTVEIAALAQITRDAARQLFNKHGSPESEPG